MPDILDDYDFGQMRGTYPMTIQYSGLKKLDDPNIEQWNIKWVVDDPDSVFHEQDVWERYYFYPGFTSIEQIDALPAKERALMLRRKTERNRRLLSLDVAEEDIKDVDVAQFVGHKAWVTVNTNNSGWSRVTAVRPFTVEDDTAINIDI